MDAEKMVEPKASSIPPLLSGWPKVQAYWVDAIKRSALRQLHASQAGERLLLRIYFIGEEATELALQRELVVERPEWLIQQMDQHLADERAHANAFAKLLAERGCEIESGAQPDWLSRRKIAKWHRIAHKYAPSFSNGVLVPAFAIGLCAELMAARVLERHIDVLSQLPDTSNLASLLNRVLNDERRHVKLCCYALDRLVSTQEKSMLDKLLKEVEAIDRSWSVVGAIGLFLVGCSLRLLPKRN